MEFKVIRVISLSDKSQQGIIRCNHCQNGKNNVGKICKYCNGTGTKIKKVGD